MAYKTTKLFCGHPSYFCGFQNWYSPFMLSVLWTIDRDLYMRYGLERKQYLLSKQAWILELRISHSTWVLWEAPEQATSVHITFTINDFEWFVRLVLRGGVWGVVQGFREYSQNSFFCFHTGENKSTSDIFWTIISHYRKVYLSKLTRVYLMKNLVFLYSPQNQKIPCFKIIGIYSMCFGHEKFCNICFLTHMGFTMHNITRFLQSTCK